MSVVEKKNSYEILCAAEKTCMIWDKKRSTLVKQSYNYSIKEIFDLKENINSIKRPECYKNLQFLELFSINIGQKSTPKRFFNTILPEFAKKIVPETIYVHIQLDKNVELSKTENAWKPSNLSEDEILQNQKTLLKSFRSSLNKLTPENFNVLLEQLKKCKIETPTELNGVVELIFEKAVDEPNFVTTYTKLCSELQSITVYENSIGTEFSFNQILIKHCQLEFEKVILEHRQTMKLRKRSCGTVIFIGELFNSGILISEIMHECIKHLLEEREDLLESLCKFLTIIGSNLEKENSDCLTAYLCVLDGIIKNKPKHINVRIRFMIQDLIDLRKKKWFSGVVKPTTLEAVEIAIIKEEVIINEAIIKENLKEEKNRIQDFRLEPNKINFIGASEINSETKLGSASQFTWKSVNPVKVEETAAVRLPLPVIPPPTFSSFFTTNSGGFNLNTGNQTVNKSIKETNQKRNSGQKSKNFDQNSKKNFNSNQQKSNLTNTGRNNNTREYSGSGTHKSTEPPRRRGGNFQEKSTPTRQTQYFNNSTYQQTSTRSTEDKDKEYETGRNHQQQQRGTNYKKRNF